MIQRQTRKPDISEEISRQARYLLKEASHNEEVRNAVVGNNTCTIKSFVYQRLRQVAPYLNYEVMLCAPGMSCYMPYQKKQEIKQDIYADDYLFSANLTVFKPTVMKLFLWMSEKGPSAAGTEEFFYPSLDVNLDGINECPYTFNPSYYNCLGICEVGEQIKCDDGSAFTLTQPTTPENENDNSCKNSIDNNCNGRQGCFGGAGLTLRDITKWENECDKKTIAQKNDGSECLIENNPPTTYGCICLESEKVDINNPLTFAACIDGFDNDGNGKCDTHGCGILPCDPNCPPCPPS